MNEAARTAEEHAAYCQSALNHLNAATEAAVDVTNRARQLEGQAAVEQWKSAIGRGRTALEVALYILQHGTSTPALFQACHTLVQALPNALSEGSLSSEDCWALRHELFNLACTWTRDQVILRQICYLVAFSTFLGVASTRVEEGKSKTAADTLQLVSSNIPIGLDITAQLVEHFDTHDSTGRIKRLLPGLTWSAGAAARRYFVDYLFVDLLGFVCNTIRIEPTLLGFKALRGLLFLQVEDAEKIPGVFGSSQRDGSEEGIVSPISLPTQLEHHVLTSEMLNLLVESYFRSLAIRSEAACFECYSCLAALCRSNPEASDITRWRTAVMQAITLLGQPLMRVSARLPSQYSSHIIGIIQAHLSASSAMVLSATPPEHLHQLLDILHKATMSLAESSTGVDLDEDSLNSFSIACSVYTQLLELVQDESIANSPKMIEHASAVHERMGEVVETWLEMHLKAIETNVHLFGHYRYEHNVDQQLYGTFLQSFALLCRTSAQRTLPLLHRLLSATYSSIASTPNGNTARLHHVQLKWILLVLGHALADAADGESPVVPAALECLARDEAGGRVLETIPIELVNVLSEMSRTAATDPTTQSVSSIIWLIGRWAATYLFPETTPESSAGRYPSAQGTGENVLRSILASFGAALKTWPTHVGVAKEVGEALSFMSRSPELIKAIVRDDTWVGLMMLVLQLSHFVEVLHNVVLRIAISSGTNFDTHHSKDLAFSSLGGHLENLQHLRPLDTLTEAERKYVLSAVKIFTALAQHAEPRSAHAIVPPCSVAVRACIAIAQDCSHTDVLFSEILDLLQNTLLLLTGGLLEETPEITQQIADLHKAIVDLVSSKYPAASRLFPDDGYIHEILGGLFKTAASAASSLQIQCCFYTAQALLPRIDPALLHYSGLVVALQSWLDAICWHHPRIMLEPLSASKHTVELVAAVYLLPLQTGDDEILQQHLDSCRMLAAVYDRMQHPLKHVDIPLRSIQSRLLQTLAHDPISTTLLSPYLQTSRAVIRALDQCGGQPLQMETLDTFVKSSTAKPNVVEGIRRLWEAMMEGDAHAGPLPKDVEAKAITALQVLRV